MNIDEIRADVARAREYAKAIFSQTDSTELVSLIDACEELVQQVEDHNTARDIQRKATLKADKMWQEATGNNDVFPDLGKLLDWLMREIEVRDLALQYACDSGEDWSQATLDTLSKGAVNQARRDIAEEAEKKTND